MSQVSRNTVAVGSPQVAALFATMMLATCTLLLHAGSNGAGFVAAALEEEDLRPVEEEVRDWCDETDAFKERDYSTASIPVFCKGLTALEVIGDVGAIALAKAMKGHPTLTMLGLSNQKIGDDGASALSETIGSTKIKELFMSNNLVGDVGAVALAKGIASSTVLENLDLYNNKIGDAGAAAFAEVAKVQTLQIQLQHNKIGVAGSAALAEALKANAKLDGLIMLEDLDGDSEIDANNPDSLSTSIADPSVDSDSDAAKSSEDSAAAATSAGSSLNPRMAGMKKRAYENPCGTHVGCEERLGDYIIARYLQLVQVDFLRLFELGITSAVDMAVMAFQDKFDSDASLFMNSALESVMLPFKPIQRKKLLHLLPAKAAKLIPLFVVGGGGGQQSDDVAENLTAFSLEEWAAQKHIAPPAAVLKQLRSLGVVQVADLAKLSKTNLVNIQAKLKLVEAWWFRNGMETTLAFLGRQQHGSSILLDADALHTLSLDEWGSQMNIPTLALEEIKTAGAEEPADLLYIDDEVLQQIYAGLTPTEIKTIEGAIGSARQTLQDAMSKKEEQEKKTNRHEEL